MKGNKRRKGSLPVNGALLRLLLLGACFLAGVCLGQVMLSRVPDAAGEELRRYLSDFIRLEGREDWSPRALWGMAMLYLRYPLLAFLEGFLMLGPVLLPCTAAAFGFFLSFSVCCLTASFGFHGVVLALALMGLRCAVTLPCFFLLAVPAMAGAAERMSFGRGRRVRHAGFGKKDWLRFGIVLAVLLAGMCVDYWISPQLLRAALAGSI